MQSPKIGLDCIHRGKKPPPEVRFGAVVRVELRRTPLEAPAPKENDTIRSKKYLTDRTSRLLAFPALVAATSLVALAADEAPADKEDASAEKSVIGATAKLTLGNTGIEFPARIDTGAKTCSLHVEEWEIEDEEETMRDNIGKPIRFRVQDPHDEENQTWVQSKVVGYAIYKTSEKGERRYKVKVKLRWKDLEKEVLVNLNDRSKMEFPLLVGRNYLRGDIVVDVDIDNDE